MHYAGISMYISSFRAIHKHTRILKPFEDSEPTGLKVDIAIIRMREGNSWERRYVKQRVVYVCKLYD